jgi:hypothetical protein
LPTILTLLFVIAAVILAGLSARHYFAVRRALRRLLPPDIRDASARRISLDITIWSKLVPVQAKWDYLLRLIYGSASGAMLTLACATAGPAALALFAGILTTAGIVQTVVSAAKYRGLRASATKDISDEVMDVDRAEEDVDDTRDTSDRRG